MTETEVRLSELRNQITHLSEITQEGWVLKWGESPQSAFEIICRNATPRQMEKLDAIVSEGYRKALVKHS
ncbi:MAG TPA: hypothetical protein V6C99_00260 [Oculatellaceae cyanobacterium]|jgi:hypothetical protein